jgi:hypothetical protein
LKNTQYRVDDFTVVNIFVFDRNHVGLCDFKKSTERSYVGYTLGEIKLRRKRNVQNL